MRPTKIQFTVEPEEYPDEANKAVIELDQGSPGQEVAIRQDEDRIIMGSGRFGAFIIACLHAYVADGGDPVDLLEAAGFGEGG